MSVARRCGSYDGLLVMECNTAPLTSRTTVGPVGTVAPRRPGWAAARSSPQEAQGPTWSERSSCARKQRG